MHTTHAPQPGLYRPTARRDDAPLDLLCDDIEATHHAFTREALDHCERLLHRAICAHRDRPELVLIDRAFFALRADLLAHLVKEERVLFPYVRALCASAGPAPRAPFGTVENPISCMLGEHDSASRFLDAMRNASSAFAPPRDASPDLVDLYASLRALDLDLREHIRIENDSVFPRAIDLERRLRGA